MYKINKKIKLINKNNYKIKKNKTYMQPVRNILLLKLDIKVKS